ncbi:MAG: putative toxin-antitoxin system toxin component, PIN family [Gemmatimonadetes bacterium]|nr:putative toxin-antitoxin system toxin component, PIN family [Gemmatimonadota bacterium]
MPHPRPPVPDCRDPFDRAFLELAAAGRADSVVTGDQDLLVLAPRFRIPIMRPDEARRRLSAVGVPPIHRHRHRPPHAE